MRCRRFSGNRGASAVRSEVFGGSWSCLEGLRSRMNRGANARVGGAAANIAAHGAVDVRITRRAILLEERRRGHDLSGLAVAALWHLQFHPGGLHRFGL